MPSLRQLYLYQDLKSDELFRVQGHVSTDDKRAVVGALADDGIITLIIQHAFRRAADYIRQNHITALDNDKRIDLLNFICYSPSACPNGTAVAPAHSGPAPRGESTQPHAPCATSRVSKSDTRGSRDKSQSKEAVSTKRTKG
jgi:hypothetical protein